MIDLAKLKVTIETDAEKAKAEIKSVGETAEKQESKFSKFGSALKTGAMVGVAGVTALATGLTAMANSASETALEIDRLSQTTGMTTKAYQEWDYIMKQNGFSMEQASGDFAALGEKALDAANGVGEGAELFSMLGVTVTDTSGKLKSQEQIFNETITALQGMENATERNAIASALLGTTGEELVPVLNMTASEVDNMKNKANELGLVMSGESIEAGTKFKQSIDTVKSSFTAVVMEIGIQFMPILQKLLDWVMAHMPEIKAIIQTVFKAVEIVVTAVGKAFDAILPILTGLYNWISPYFPVIQSIVENTFKGITKAVDTVTKAFKAVKDAISDAIDMLTFWDNKESESNKSTKSSIKIDGSHANGLEYVPYNSYIAELHKGERVLTAQENKSFNNIGAEIVNALTTVFDRPNKNNSPINLVLNVNGKEFAQATYNDFIDEGKRMGVV